MKWFNRKRKKSKNKVFTPIVIPDENVDSDITFNKLVIAEEKREVKVEPLQEGVELTTAEGGKITAEILTLSQLNQINKYLNKGYSRGYVPKIVKDLKAKGEFEKYVVKLDV